MFCCALLCVHSSIAVILVGRGLVDLLGLSSWCLVVVGRLFLAVPRVYLQFVIVVFPDHTHLLFLISFLSRANVRAFHENPNIYTLNTHLLTLKAHNHKLYVFYRPLNYLKLNR